MKLPVIAMAPLFGGNVSARNCVAQEIASACRDTGFFYVTDHGIPQELLAQLDSLGRQFFALPETEKMQIAMAKGGRAWRGFFPVGGELTSGKADIKEGIYFGSELSPHDPRVKEGLPLHGANLFPLQVPALRDAVLAYFDAATRTAHALMGGVALSLGLDPQYFREQYTTDPTILFRIFHYPSATYEDGSWGVGEHTDYGLLTLLAQDNIGGLEVKSKSGWIGAPPIPGTLVCNIGDMLDRLTGGAYKSTPHRAKNVSGRSRISFPFFFDPGFDAKIVPLPATAVLDDRGTRWDKASVHDFQGTYGEYLLGKVSKVFPELSREVI